MSNLNDGWTDERIEVLRKHFANGVSAGQSARQLGVSRNAVIGKRHRLGMTFAGHRSGKLPGEYEVWSDVQTQIMTQGVADGLSDAEISVMLGGVFSKDAIRKKRHRIGLNRPSAVGGPGAPRAPAVKRDPHASAGANFPHAPRPKAAPLPTPALEPCVSAKPWTERASGECTWPVSGDGADILSCCKPIAVGSWCAEHNARGRDGVQRKTPKAPPEFSVRSTQRRRA